MNNVISIEQRLRETFDERRYYLDLRELGLHEIPPEVTRMGWLRNIALSRNTITDLSPLASLPQLHKAALTDNRIEDLSPLATLSELKYLFAGGNRIHDLAPLAGKSRLKNWYSAATASTTSRPYPAWKIWSITPPPKHPNSSRGIGNLGMLEISGDSLRVASKHSHELFRILP